jgi:hypothetical protein
MLVVWRERVRPGADAGNRAGGAFVVAQAMPLVERGAGGRAAPGVIFHWASVTPDGIHAVDVYESREAADGLAGEQIAPIAADLGLSLPEVVEYPVHATLS